MIPKPIYEILPILYVILGVVAMLNFNVMTTPFASGLILAVVGIIILFLRRNYRAEQEVLAKF